MKELGYSVISTERLDAAGSTLTILHGPTEGPSILPRLTREAPASTFGLNHIFEPAAGDLPAHGVAPVGPHAGRPCRCRIGMIDTGVEASGFAPHGAKLAQRGFGGGAAMPQAHGEAVAALMLEQISDAHGAATGAELYVADIFSPGAQSGTAAALVSGLSWLADSGASVINVSLAGPPNPVVAKVIERIAARGVLVVAAAGNDGPAAPPVFPAAYPEVVAVTAVDALRKPYRYANRGPYVMFAALGVDVRAAAPSGPQTVSGTSFAAPTVAVELARRLPAADPAAARRAVQAVTAQAVDLGAPGRDPVFGYGLIEPRP